MFLTREQQYIYLKAVKQGKFPDASPLTESEEQFIQDYALELVKELMSDPECMAALQRLKEK